MSAAQRAATRRQTITTDDGAHLAVYTDGSPKAAVTYVLAHGWLMSARAWRLQVGPLVRAGHRVVRMDWRGHGNSTVGLRATTVDVLADDLAEAIDATAPRGELRLAGHSMGGMALMALAARYPHILARAHMALLSTTHQAVVYRPGNRPTDYARGLWRWSYGTASASAPIATDWVRKRLPNAASLVLRAGKVDPDGGPVQGRSATAFTSTLDLAPLWRSLRTDRHGASALAGLAALGDRVHLMTGAADTMIPPWQTEALAELLPGAEFHPLVPGAGHILPMQAHREVTGLLLKLGATAADVPPASGSASTVRG